MAVKGRTPEAELFEAAAEIRSAIREAHEVMRDLKTAVKEAKQARYEMCEVAQLEISEGCENAVANIRRALDASEARAIILQLHAVREKWYENLEKMAEQGQALDDMVDRAHEALSVLTDKARKDLQSVVDEGSTSMSKVVCAVERGGKEMLVEKLKAVTDIGGEAINVLLADLTRQVQAIFTEEYGTVFVDNRQPL